MLYYNSEAMVAKAEAGFSPTPKEQIQLIWNRDIAEGNSMVWQAHYNYDSEETYRVMIENNVMSMVCDQFPAEPNLGTVRKPLHEINPEEVTNTVFTLLEKATAPNPPSWVVLHEKQGIIGKTSHSGPDLPPRYVPYLMDAYGLVDGNRKTYAEIARERGITASAVRERVIKARRRLFSNSNLRSKVSNPSILFKEAPSSL
jgi:hypothetical protein